MSYLLMSYLLKRWFIDSDLGGILQITGMCQTSIVNLLMRHQTFVLYRYRPDLIDTKPIPPRFYSRSDIFHKSCVKPRNRVSGIMERRGLPKTFFVERLFLPTTQWSWHLKTRNLNAGLAGHRTNKKRHKRFSDFECCVFAIPISCC
jgi:hypothetical protein